MGDFSEFDGDCDFQASRSAKVGNDSPLQSHVDQLFRRHRLLQIKKRMRYFRFRLRTMLLVATAFCLICAALQIYGTVSRKRAPVPVNQANIPSTSVANAAAIPLLVSSWVVGPLVAACAYKLGSAKGYVLFAALSFVALLLLIASLSLHTGSIFVTQVRDMRFAEGLRVSLPLVVGVLPLSSFLGCYFAAREDRT
jgi:hypothetical protein